MTDDPLKPAARRIACEYLVCHVYNIVLKAIGADETFIGELERAGLNTIGLQPIVEGDPAMSDHASAEVRDALADLLKAAREMRGVVQRPE